MSLPLLVIGAGGHARVLIDALTGQGRELAGIVDRDPARWGSFLLGVQVLGGDDLVARFAPESVLLVNGVGSVGGSGREELYRRFTSLGYRFASVVHPSAVVGREAELAQGVQVMAGAVVQSGSVVGVNSIVNTRAGVDHDCRIAPHVHVAPGATLCGSVTVGEGSHVGAGATVIQGVSIGRFCMVAAGAVVVRDLPDGSSVMGVPARRKER